MFVGLTRPLYAYIIQSIMLIGELPKIIDVRKLAHRGVHLEGSLDLCKFSRLTGAFVHDQGKVHVSLDFYLDEFSNVVVSGHLSLECKMVCQRCLEVAIIPVAANVMFMAVRTDEQAKALPTIYDPLFLQDDPVELVSLLEDELLLALPLIPYHDSGLCSIEKNCSSPYVGASHHENREGDCDKYSLKENPFRVLSKIKVAVKKSI